MWENYTTRYIRHTGTTLPAILNGDTQIRTHIKSLGRNTDIPIEELNGTSELKPTDIYALFEKLVMFARQDIRGIGINLWGPAHIGIAHELGINVDVSRTMNKDVDFSHLSIAIDPQETYFSKIKVFQEYGLQSKSSSKSNMLYIENVQGREMTEEESYCYSFLRDQIIVPAMKENRLSVVTLSNHQSNGVPRNSEMDRFMHSYNIVHNLEPKWSRNGISDTLKKFINDSLDLTVSDLFLPQWRGVDPIMKTLAQTTSEKDARDYETYLNKLISEILAYDSSESYITSSKAALLRKKITCSGFIVPTDPEIAYAYDHRPRMYNLHPVVHMALDDLYGMNTYKERENIYVK